MQLLGMVEHVNLRDIWEDESIDFTPWLAQSEHLHLLGIALAMDLIVEETEYLVGAKRADIVARDLITDTLVVIENQLECADHSHLGQIVTYASGTGARAAIWIASQFAEEHIDAIGWLNGLNDQFQVFAVELELLKIGESLPAPIFSLVASSTTKLKQTKRVRQKDKPRSIPKEIDANNYPFVISEWIEKDRKTVTMDEISLITGLSKRLVTKASFKRSPRNPDLVLVSSVIEWLKTIPASVPSPTIKTDPDTQSLLHIVNS